MDPINYRIDVLNPFQTATSGMQAGFGAINNINALQDRQAQIEAQKQAQAAAMAKKQQMNAVLQAHMQKPSYETATQIAALYPKDQAEQINNVFKSWEEGKQKNVSTNLMNIQAGLDSGNPEVGMDLLNKYEESLKNSGADPMQLEFVSGLKRIAEEKGAGAASFALTGPLAHAIGVDKYSQYRQQMESARTTLEKRPYEVATARSESFIKEEEAKNTPKLLALKNRYTEKQIQDIDSQIIDRANRFGLEQDKLRSDIEMKLMENSQRFGELPEGINKEVTAATSESIAAGQAADNALQLAVEIENAAKEGMKSGVPAKLAELWKKQYGSQDELTALRKRFAGIATGAAMTAYKKYTSGQTSDKDVEMAMRPVPDDNADPLLMAQYLRGVSKLQRYEEVLGAAKSEWFGAVKGLGKAKTDLVIDGVRVPAGTSFKGFVDKYVPAKVNQTQTTAAQAELPNRSYMVHATGAQ